MTVQGQAPKPTVTLTYDNASRLTSIVRGQITLTNATITTTFGYDNANRLTGITHISSAAGTLMTLTYGYDAANQLTSYSGPDGSLTYGYDSDGQLTGVSGAHNETYTYDKQGNRTMTGYTTTIGNRLTADGTYTYSYDNDGNMVGRTRTSDSQVTTFTYDFRNRLTEVLIKTSGGTTVQDDKFTYDVENHRIGKNMLSGGQSWTGYDGANPYADFNSSGSLTYRYLYACCADSLLARVDTSGTPTWYLTDKLGSVREDVNTSGSVLDSITYDSYGNILSESNSSNGDRFKYTGREWDSEIGAYYYRARYYSPTIGRFLSEDPLGFGGGDENLYRYVDNRPNYLTDPSGEAPKPFPACPVNEPNWLVQQLQGSLWPKPVFMGTDPIKWDDGTGKVHGTINLGVLQINSFGTSLAEACANLVRWEFALTASLRTRISERLAWAQEIAKYKACLIAHGVNPLNDPYYLYELKQDARHLSRIFLEIALMARVSVLWLQNCRGQKVPYIPRRLPDLRPMYRPSEPGIKSDPLPLIGAGLAGVGLMGGAAVGATARAVQIIGSLVDRFGNLFTNEVPEPVGAP
jgi:RHS repeat-associated protein